MINLLKLMQEYTKAKTDFEDTVTKKIAEKIKDVRESKNMSQEDLALACDMKRPTIAMIETARQGVTVVQLMWIAAALNCDICEIISSAKGSDD